MDTDYVVLSDVHVHLDGLYALPLLREVEGEERHEEDPGGVGTCLGVGAGFEDDHDGEGDGCVDEDHRPDRPCPLGSHAVAGQITWYDVYEPGHRGGPREPEYGCGGEVVNRPEGVAQIHVGQVGEGASV